MESKAKALLEKTLAELKAETASVKTLRVALYESEESASKALKAMGISPTSEMLRQATWGAISRLITAESNVYRLTVVQRTLTELLAEPGVS